MADASFATSLIDQLAPLGALRQRRFFSGQGIVAGDVQFAMILGGMLYLRVDADLAARMQAHGAQPFVYGTRKRDVTVASYYGVPEECLDDIDVLTDWARRSLAVARQKHAAKPPARKRASSVARKPKQ